MSATAVDGYFPMISSIEMVTSSSAFRRIVLLIFTAWTLLGPFIYSIMEKAKEGTERERANLNCTSVRKVSKVRSCFI